MASARRTNGPACPGRYVADIFCADQTITRIERDIAPRPGVELVDAPNYRGTLSVKTQTMNVDYNPFEAMATEGRPRIVTVRGPVAVRDGSCGSRPDRGRFLPRKPSHV